MIYEWDKDLPDNQGIPWLKGVIITYHMQLHYFSAVMNIR